MDDSAWRRPAQPTEHTSDASPRRPMNRRHLLTLCGAGLVGLAGCADGSATGPSVEVTRTRVLPAMVVRTFPDAIGVVSETDRRYLLATVEVDTESEAESASTLDRDEFSLTVGRQTYDPRTELGRYAVPERHAVAGPTYGGGASRGSLLFEVSQPETLRTVALSWPGGETTLDGAGEALVRPESSVTIDSFRAESEEPERVTLSAEIRNGGDHRDWFVGAVNRQGPSVAITPVRGFAVELDPGATETWTHVDDSLGGTGTARYTLRTTEGSHETSVEV